MFNGYHEPPATSYNDLELERGKKNQSASKWPCVNGTSVQPSHLHTQNLQPEIWASKPPFIGLSHSVNVAPKCNCPGCYQSLENQSYPGDLSWHRTWFSRAYSSPVNSPQDAKLQGNHRCENSALPTESYPESNQYMQENGDKSIFYKSYQSLRHSDIYQTGVMSTVKTCSIRTEDLPKQEIPEVAHRLAPSAAYDPFRDRRRIEDGNFFNNSLESCRHQAGLAQYHLHPRKHTILESFSKSVPSNMENRVPSVDHPNSKQNVLHSYVDQNGIGKINQLPEDKLNRLLPEQGQENLNFQSDHHAFNRDFATDKKFINGRHPQYFPRNNFPEMIKRTTQGFMLNRMDSNKKAVINPQNAQGVISPQIPNHMPHSPSCGKFSLNDCTVPEKVAPVMNHKLAVAVGFQGRDEMQQNHILRQQIDTEKDYIPMLYQNKSCRRPEYYRRNIWNDEPMDQQMIPNFPELRNGLDLYTQQEEKQHYQVSNDIKSQAPFFGNSRAVGESESFRHTAKENTDKISHLESIRYEELCKNGNSKISPLRLLRKKKFNHQKKENTVESTIPDVTNEAPPLDVRRFWATWADEEEENVPQTQMVVLDCHNIDPEQAELLNLYNSEPIRTVHLEEGSFLRAQLDKPNEESKVMDFENLEVARPESSEAKASKNPELTFGMPLFIESDSGISKPYSTDTNYQRSEDEMKTDVKQVEIIKHCENDLELEFNDSGLGKCDDSETAVLLKKDNLDSENMPPNDHFLKEEDVGVDEDGTKESIASRSSNDSQIDVPDLPTSEYRKNKFLDYSDSNLLSLETHHNEPAKTYELMPGNFELDEILKKLSIINFQSPDSSNEIQHKTDNKKQSTKTKKSCCKSSRSDELTPQNISLTKPTIKFSIQKSHDLKISFKVLNKKFENEDGAREVDQNLSEVKEDAEGVKKSRRRLITLKLKDLSDKGDDNYRKSKGFDDLRKSRKALKKKKIRSERSPSPKTPILKIKKSRYMLRDALDEVPEAASDGVPNEVGAHGDFQVHETVESAKIKLTFKRNKNNTVKRKKDSDEELSSREEQTEVIDEDNESPFQIQNSKDMPLTSDSIPKDDMRSPVGDAENEITESPEPSPAFESLLESSHNGLPGKSDLSVTVMSDNLPPISENKDSLIEENDIFEGSKCSKNDTEEKLWEIPVAYETILHVEDEKYEEPGNAPEEKLENQNHLCSNTDISVAEEAERGEELLGYEGNTTENAGKVDEGELSVSSPREYDIGNEETFRKDPKDDETKQIDALEKMDFSSDVIQNKNDGVVALQLSDEKSPLVEVSDLNEKDVEDIKEREVLATEAEDITDAVNEKLIKEMIMEEDSPEEGELVAEEEELKDIEQVHPTREDNSLKNMEPEDEKFPEQIKPKKINQEQVDIIGEAEGLKNVIQIENITEESKMEQDDPEEGELIEEAENTHTDTSEIPVFENTMTLSATHKPHPEFISDVEMSSELCIIGEPLETEGMEVIEENKTSLTCDKIIFMDRMISRRQSCDTQEQMPGLRRRRAASVNVELRMNNSCPPPTTEEELSVLDIPVCDIPLPFGDAPAANCINWKEYFTRKLTNVLQESIKSSFPVEDAGHGFEENTVQDLAKDPETESMIPEQKEGQSFEMIVGIEELPDDLGNQLHDFTVIEKGNDCVRDDTLRCEFEGLAFDENLTIADDMEEEKVSDDDKFRDIMQNCLDNAKKFLSVGNMKLPTMDDLSETDVKPKDFGKFVEVTDFLSDPDALPLDNWPYLEEEVPSSPRGEADHSDLLFLDEVSTGYIEKSRRVSLSEVDIPSKSAPQRRKTIEGIARWKSFHDSGEEVCDFDDSKRSTEDDEGSNKILKKNPSGLYYKSSSWQPKVVLFRISKNLMNSLPANNIPKEQISVESIRKILAQDDRVKVKKKQRFRNLHVKKKIVHDGTEISKDKHVDSVILNKQREADRDAKNELERRKLNEKEKSDHKKHSERYKRKRDHGEEENKKERSRENWRRPHEGDKRSKRNEKPNWCCEVCGFSKASERATHIQNHPFHCQSCHLAFKTEANFVDHLTRKHKDIRNQHHCLLCELSFDLEKDYYGHLETREHRHLEAVEKNTINTLFTLLTGHPCPVLGPVESKPEWLPTQAGTVHFYHQATPLSLALQYLKLHDKKNLASATLSPQ